MDSLLYDKVYGCLTGGLIGDAMGAPAEGKTHEWIAENLGWIEDFEGDGTDDSAIKMILIDALLKTGGHATCDDFAESFLRNSKYYHLFYIPVRNMYAKIRDKTELPIYAGWGNMQSSSSVMAISPMGIINACDPRRAARETFDVASLVHNGPTGFCRDGACAMAAAVAEAMKPGATVESVLCAATAYLHTESAKVMREHIAKVLELARSSASYETFRKAFYESCLYTELCDSRETVPAALAIFALAEGNPEKGITYSANFGRDADTIATMVGALSGAFTGTKGLKPAWLEKIKANAPAQAEVAASLVALIKQRAGEQQNVLDSLKAMG